MPRAGRAGETVQQGILSADLTPGCRSVARTLAPAGCPGAQPRAVRRSGRRVRVEKASAHLVVFLQALRETDLLRPREAPGEADHLLRRYPSRGACGLANQHCLL